MAGEADGNMNQIKHNSGEQQGNICRDYQRGVCHRGNKCKFDHPPDVQAPMQERLPICRDFQNGKCSRSNCKYMHITSEEERIYMKTGQLPPSSSAGNSSAPPPSMPCGDQVCKDFLNNICNRGNSCKFRHISEEEYQRQKGPSDEMPRKRRRDSYGSGGGGGGGMDMQFMQEENDMLRRKVADLQRQVADLRTMNDTLYEQNTRYRSQAQGGMDNNSSRGGSMQYSGYSRESSAPGYSSYSSSTSAPGTGYDGYP